MAHKGVFKPINPSKYKGDPSNVVYRSRWELLLMSQVDRNPNVLQWSSEEIIIRYRSPMDGKIHRYFPDLWIKKINASDGQIVECLIEIKPKAQCKPPTVQKKATKRYITEVHTWGVNSAKWAAAEQYCTQRGWQWVIITEDDLGLTF